MVKVRPARCVPLEQWAPVHPAARAWAQEEWRVAPVPGDAPQRRAGLAAALAAANRRWGNDVDGVLDQWLAGATAVVSGQQPGVFGGPLLTLVKAAAVAAEVARRRRQGKQAVGFLWLATTDDDLPEMTWGRVVFGEEFAEVRLPGERGERMGGALVVGPQCALRLAELEQRCSGEFCSQALALAVECFAPETTLGEAACRFLARLLAGTGVVLVDAREPELARAGGETLAQVLSRLPEAWDALADAAAAMAARGWSAPLRLDRGRLPVFRVEGDRRRRLAAQEGRCPESVVRELSSRPEGFLPNVWLRPLLQDAALGTSVAFLGGAELSYHVQGAELWPLAGLPRPQWRLRPHVTVLTSGDRHLIAHLGLEPADLLRTRPPRRVLGGGTTWRRLERARRQALEGLDAVAAAAREELPALQGEVSATTRKVDAALTWLEERAQRAATARQDTSLARWRRLQAFLRPRQLPQERGLSVLAPVLRLGLPWPSQLAAALDPGDPGMQLLYWDEGGLW